MKKDIVKDFVIFRKHTLRFRYHWWEGHGIECIPVINIMYGHHYKIVEINFKFIWLLLAMEMHFNWVDFPTNDEDEYKSWKELINKTKQS